MSLMVSLVGGDSSGGVTVPVVDADNFLSPLSKPVKSGVKFDADGNVYVYNQDGAFSNSGTWLLGGTAASYYLVRTIDSGSLAVDAGAGPLQLNTDRIYSVTATTFPVFCSVTFDITDSGGSTVYASGTIGLSVD